MRGRVGYSHPPTVNEEEAAFIIYMDGHRFKVSVQEVTPTQELAQYVAARVKEAMVE